MLESKNLRNLKLKNLFLENLVFIQPCSQSAPSDIFFAMKCFFVYCREIKCDKNIAIARTF